jgi:hypothetical protein
LYKSEDDTTGGAEYTTVRCCRWKSGSFSSCCRLRHVTLDIPPIVAAAGNGLGASYNPSVTTAAASPPPAPTNGMVDVVVLLLLTLAVVVGPVRDEEDWDVVIPKDGDVLSAVSSCASPLFVQVTTGEADASSLASLKIRALASAYAFSNSVRLPRLANVGVVVVVVVVVPDVDDNESCCGNNKEIELFFLVLLWLLLLVWFKEDDVVNTDCKEDDDEDCRFIIFILLLGRFCKPGLVVDDTPLGVVVVVVVADVVDCNGMGEDAPADCRLVLFLVPVVRRESWDMSFPIAVVASVGDDSFGVGVVVVVGGWVWMMGAVTFWVMKPPSSSWFPILLLLILLPAAAGDEAV